MPKAKKKHREPYEQPADLENILQDIKNLLVTINGMQFHCHKIKQMMLKRSLWLAIELTGNFRCRLRSDGVLSGSELGVSIQRDHVFTRKSLMRALKADNPDYDQIIRKSQVCCLVTTDEHQRLTNVDDKIKGWKRYETAGIVWHDMLTYRPE